MELPRVLWNFRSTLLIMLLPLVLLPLPLILQDPVASCGYVIIIMAAFWITEALPLAVTAFLPLIMFPLMGIMSASEISTAYLKDTIWLFTGGLLIAVAVEHTGLHKRVALNVLLFVGTKPHSLMLGFMAPTYFLSMWISNTATTAMMLPIADAVMSELISQDVPEHEQTLNTDADPSVREIHSAYEVTAFYANDQADTSSPKTQEHDVKKVPQIWQTSFKKTDLDESVSIEIENITSVEVQERDEEKEKMKKGLTICVPFAASIGGTTTLTGSPPNTVLAGQFPVLFPYADGTVSFSIWFLYHLPISLLLFFLAYIWLMWMYLGLNFKMTAGLCKGKRNDTDKRIREVLKQQRGELGDTTWAEVTVMVVFLLTALLWFFREPGFMPGWAILFRDGFVSDGTVAMTTASLLFFLPSRKPTFLRRRSERMDDPVTNCMKPVPAVLDWKTAQRMLPWNVTLLIGGGFALAEGCLVSGFSEWLGYQLSFLDAIPDWSICLVITVVISLLTEVTSNTATASLFVPIVAQLAQVTEIHPIYLLEPMVVATSLAFMLPVATPPNAIAFSYGRLEVSDLVKAGWLMNLLGVLVLIIFINTYGVALFDLDEFPDWAAANYTPPLTTLAP